MKVVEVRNPRTFIGSMHDSFLIYTGTVKEIWENFFAVPVLFYLEEGVGYHAFIQWSGEVKAGAKRSDIHTEECVDEFCKLKRGLNVA